MRALLKCLLLVLFLTLVLGDSRVMGQLFFLENPNVGSPAPDFTLDTLKEKNVNMTKYREGKNAIIFFWATWCPHCREALKNLNNNAAQLQDKGIKVILVDLGETVQEVRQHIEKNKINFDVFLDTKNFLSEPYGIIGVPTFFFLNDQGVVKAVEHAMPENYEEIFFKKAVSKETDK